MDRSATVAAFVVLLVVCRAFSQQPEATGSKSVSSKPRPSPEMQRLFDAFAGRWEVSETFEVSPKDQGRTRQGTATFREGPGYSLIEDYRSTGSAGDLRFLGLFWWDQSAHTYRLLTCANNDGCELRGTVKWEGQRLVNSWDNKVGGKTATFKDSFVDISPSSFHLVSEGTADGKTIWRVVTRYRRLAASNER